MKRIFLFLACIVCLQSSLAQEKMRITLNDGTYMDFDVEKQLNKITYQKEERENDYAMGM